MKDAYLKFMLATVIYGTNGIVASHIPLSSYEIVLTRTVLGSLQQGRQISVIAVGPDAEAAQFKLDRHVLPALRPNEGNDAGPVDIAELESQKDSDADDSRK